MRPRFTECRGNEITSMCVWSVMFTPRQLHGRFGHPHRRLEYSWFHPVYFLGITFSKRTGAQKKTSVSCSFDKKRGAMEGVRAVERAIRLLLFEAPPQDLQSAFNC